MIDSLISSGDKPVAHRWAFIQGRLIWSTMCVQHHFVPTIPNRDKPYPIMTCHTLPYHIPHHTIPGNPKEGRRLQQLLPPAPSL